MKNFSVNKQGGAVLIVGLIMLLLLTIIGLASIQDASFQESMASNLKDRNMAFQAAESGLRDGEVELAKINIAANVLASPVDNPGDPCFWEGCGSATGFNWTGGSVNVAATSLSSVAASPRYVLEELDKTNAPGCTEKEGSPQLMCEVQFYRVTARAVGATDSSVVVLQSTYKR